MVLRFLRRKGAPVSTCSGNTEQVGFVRLFHLNTVFVTSMPLKRARSPPIFIAILEPT